VACANEGRRWDNFGLCPLYPRKRTCAAQLAMSALGQKRHSGYLFGSHGASGDKDVANGLPNEKE
jgi:hypothetical protein